MSKKNIMAILFLAALLSMGVVFVQKTLLNSDNRDVEVVNQETDLLFGQKIISYEKEPILYYKLFKEGKLMAIMTDQQKLLRAFQEEYRDKYQEEYPHSECGLVEGWYITQESVYFRIEDKDDEIVNYLKNGAMGVRTNVVEFSTNEGVYEAIYVKDVAAFKKAQRRFLRNFVSEEFLRSLELGESPAELTEYGISDMGLHIQENVNIRKAIAKPENILIDESEIYEFLCYGRNKERQYYVVQEGDTLAGIGFFFKDMSASQIMMLNSETIYSTDQILVPGTSLNVTYYTSPLTVVVRKERLAKEVINPEAPQYIEDPNLFTGEQIVVTAEASGYRNVLYEEEWINGVQQEGSVIHSSSVRLQAVQGVIRTGTKPLPNVGTGHFIWPIDNVSITCPWGCYPGHQGTDLQNMYNRYDNVYASDNGTVEEVTYDSIGGHWILINHNNGYHTYYGHLNVPAYPKVGETVVRGQIIGQIGMTGYATGPHVHFEIRINRVKVDACTIMPCGTVPWR